MDRITVTGSEHEFVIRYLDTYVVANVWHSDKGEWTVETVDGPVYREATRDAAIDRARRVGERKFALETAATQQMVADMERNGLL